MSNPAFVNCNVRIPVEQQHALLEIAQNREVRLADVMRDAINTYLGGDRGDMLVGPEAGFLYGRNRAMQAVLKYLNAAAAKIPIKGAEIEAWVDKQLG